MIIFIIYSILSLISFSYHSYEIPEYSSKQRIIEYHIVKNDNQIKEYEDIDSLKAGYEEYILEIEPEGMSSRWHEE